MTLLFADDTTFLLSSTNLQNLFELANTELNKAGTWFQVNKLILNVSKGRCQKDPEGGVLIKWGEVK